MGLRQVKRPVYDGNACMLYDYMVTKGLTEETVVELMGFKINVRAPWYPVSVYIQEPVSIPRHLIPKLCMVLNAPIEAVFVKSRFLNGLKFSMRGDISNREKLQVEGISSESMTAELQNRGYRIFKEV